MKNIIFIAPPAAGKGTQSELLKTKYNYMHISTGDMIREEISKKTQFGEELQKIIEKGELVSDEYVIKLITQKLNLLNGNPFILDGFPRTINQAIALNDLLDDNYVAIYLELDKEKAMKRSLGRITCSCGQTYNLYEESLKPKNEGICDNCGKALEKRTDDNEETFNKRFDTFITSTKPITEFYQKQDKLSIINVDRDVNEIFKEIEKVINDKYQI